MNKVELKKISKTLSLVLRHNPDYLGVELDHEGWALVADILSGFEIKGFL